MKHIWIIFKKEVVYTLRDKRSMVVMIIIPLLLFPSIFIIMGSVQKAATKDEFTRGLKVGYYANGDDAGLKALLAMDTAMHIQTYPDTLAFRGLVRSDSLDLAIALPSDFAAQQSQMGTSKVQVWYDQTSEGPIERAKIQLKIFEEMRLKARLDSLHITRAHVVPIEIEKRNTASIQETVGKLAGGFLPYIFIAFCYMGCMFPAIDLFTGEKERGTIETILATPVDRWKLLTGKMLVVIASGMTTAFLALFGMFVGMSISDTLPPVLLEVIYSILTPGFILTFLLMLLPLVTFFGGIMIPATVYAKSFKEAQSILTPLNFLVITPAIVGMMPGIELNAVTACIPVLNVVLATKDLIAGSIDPLHFVLLMASLLLVAGISIAVSFRRFGNERNILRT